MGVGDYLRVLRSRWLTVTVVVALTLVPVLAYLRTATPEYVARTSVFVSVGTSGTSARSLSNGFLLAQRQVRSYTELVLLPVVLEPVVAELGLATTPARLARAVGARAAAGTVVIEISAADPTPETAAAIADSVSRHLVLAVQDLAPTGTAPGARVEVVPVSTATVPSEPSRPRPRLTLAVGLVLGLLLGGLAALARDFVRPSDPRDPPTPSGGQVAGPSVGGVPVLATLSRDGASADLVAAVRGVVRNDGVRTVALTAARPGAADAAARAAAEDVAGTLSRQGVRVLLVDVPRDGSAAGGRRGRAGPGTTACDDGPDRSHWLGGVHAPDPADVADRLVEAGRRYDLVVLSAPPIAHADGLALAGSAESVVLVAASRGGREAVTDAAQALASGRGRLTGVALVR